MLKRLFLGLLVRVVCLKGDCNSSKSFSLSMSLLLLLLLVLLLILLLLLSYSSLLGRLRLKPEESVGSFAAYT